MSARPVAIVTDSTADLPPELALALGVTVVPLSVRFGDQSYLDGIEITPAEFLRRLQISEELPKTSQPPVTTFESVFRPLVDSGHDVVCITIASGLSGTFNAARLAAEAVDPDRVRVVDSKGVAMQTGVVVIEAASAAQAAEDLESILGVVEDAVSRSHLFAALHTLDYVHKGGRIGKASHLIGSFLDIKPILSVRDGEVIPAERSRSWRKALTRLVELTEALGPLDTLIIGHTGNPDEANEVRQRLCHLVPEDRLFIAEAGPVLTTYSGPGAVATGALVARERNVRSSTLETAGC
jgi:DegV family protein with EDD domain